MTFIGITASSDRALLKLRAGELVPRVIQRRVASACIALIARGALLLGGDQVRISVHVGAGCTLEIEEIAGTVAYDANGQPSGWHVRIRVDRGGLLIWNGLPFIVASGADVTRSTDIVLEDGARAYVREILVFGRSGEHGGTLRTSTAAHLSGAPLFIERLAATGARPAPGVLGDARVIDSVQIFGDRLTTSESALVAAGQLLVLDGPGTIARYLGRQVHLSPLSDVWRRWRMELLEQSSHDSSQ